MRLMNREKRKKRKILSKKLGFASNNILKEEETKMFYEKITVNLNAKDCENF